MLEIANPRLTARARQLKPIRHRKDINTGQNKWKREYDFLGRTEDPRKGVVDEALQGFPNGYFFNSSIKKERIFPTVQKAQQTREKSRMGKAKHMTAAQKMAHEQNVKTKVTHKKHMEMQNRTCHDTSYRRAGVWFKLIHGYAFKRQNIKFSEVTQDYAAEAVNRCSLDQIDLMRLKAQFNAMDTDESGDIDYAEFQYLMNWEKLETYSEYISTVMFQFVDKNHSRSLDFSEYVHLVCELCTYSYDQLLHFLFYTLFDTDGSGKIEQHEYLDLLSKLNARYVKRLPRQIGDLLAKMREQDKEKARKKRRQKAAEMGVEIMEDPDEDQKPEKELIPEMDFTTFCDFCGRPKYSFMIKPMLELQKRMRVGTLGLARWRRACKFLKVTDYMLKNDGNFPPGGLGQKLRTKMMMCCWNKHPYDGNVVAIRRMKVIKTEKVRLKRKNQQIWADDYKDLNEGGMGCEARELNYTQNYFFRPHRMGIANAAHGIKWRNLTHRPVAGLSDAETLSKPEKNASLGSC